VIHRERDSVKTRNFRIAVMGRLWRPDHRNSLPGGYSEWEPPDPFPNSEVKTLCADGSVAASHARVGHCQALKWNAPQGSKDLEGHFALGSIGPS